MMRDIARLFLVSSLILGTVAIVVAPESAYASGGGSGSSGGGGGGGTANVDSIKVSKCFYDAGSGQMLIKASSSDPTAHLFAFLPSGAYLGEVQNGGGSRYGGTVMGYVGADPVYILIASTSGGSILVPTTPFHP
jgi:hypothetical protein